MERAVRMGFVEYVTRFLVGQLWVSSRGTEQLEGDFESAH